MDKNFCQKIDNEDLVEKYIAGKLQGKLLKQMEAHLAECPVHSEAVNLERIVSRGVRDFARTELKAKLRSHIKTHEISKYYILRYAAILIVAIMAPIILYYQVLKMPADITSVAEPEKLKIDAERKATPAPAQAGDMISETTTPKISKTSEQTHESSKPASAMRAKQMETKTVSSLQAPAQVNLDLIKEQVYILLNKNGEKIRGCIINPELNDSNLLMLEFILQPDGSVSDIQFEPQKYSNEKNRQCIADLLKEIQFPVPETPQTITWNILMQKPGE